MKNVNAIIYNRVSHESQDLTRQLESLKKTAAEKGWYVMRVFSEKVSGTSKVSERHELNKLLSYIKHKPIDVVMTSEVSRIGRRVIDVLNVVDQIHENSVGVYIEQFNMISMENKKVNQSMSLLLQVLAMGAEMETNIRRERQRQGIEMAKLKGKYLGRKPQAKADPSKLLKKYADVVDLIKSSNLSLRRISSITGRSVNTVMKVKRLMNLL